MDDAAILALTLVPGMVVVGLATWSVATSNADEGALPNNWSGMRTKATKSSPQAWVRGHRAAVGPATTTMRFGLVSALAALVLSLGSLAIEQLAVPAAVVAVVGFVGVVAGCLYACLVADRAARNQATEVL